MSNSTMSSEARRYWVYDRIEIDLRRDPPIHDWYVVMVDASAHDAQAQQLAAVREQVKACHDALDFAQGAIRDAIHLEDGLDGAAGEACLRIIVEAVERGTFDQADPKDIDIMTKHRRHPHLIYSDWFEILVGYLTNRRT